MGLYKRLSENREELRRYNAAKRRAERLAGADSSRLVRLETVSETERFEMARDADRLTAFNKAVEKWADETTNISFYKNTNLPWVTVKCDIIDKMFEAAERNGMKLISDLGPAVIAGVSTIIAAILSRKKNAPSPQLPPPAPQLPPPVIIVVIGGERKEIQDVAEINIAGDAQ